MTVKIFKVIGFLMLLSLLFSCEKDEGDSYDLETDIIGSWVMTDYKREGSNEIHFNSNDSTQLTTFTEIGIEFDWLESFYQDSTYENSGSFTIEQTSISNGKTMTMNSETKAGGGSNEPETIYIIDDNEIVLLNKASKLEVGRKEVKSLTEDKLVLTRLLDNKNYFIGGYSILKYTEEITYKRF